MAATVAVQPRRRHDEAASGWSRAGGAVNRDAGSRAASGRPALTLR